MAIAMGRPGVVNNQPRGRNKRTIDYSSPQGARST